MKTKFKIGLILSLLIWAGFYYHCCFITGMCKVEEVRHEKPVLIATPIPPEGVLRVFSRYYNERNSAAIYSMFSEKVKAEYTLKDVEEQLRFAEKYGIKIIGQKPLSEIIERNETTGSSLHLLNTSLTLMVDGETKEITF